MLPVYGPALLVVVMADLSFQRSRNRPVSVVALALNPRVFVDTRKQAWQIYYPDSVHTAFYWDVYLAPALLLC